MQQTYAGTAGRALAIELSIPARAKAWPLAICLLADGQEAPALPDGFAVAAVRAPGADLWDTDTCHDIAAWTHTILDNPQIDPMRVLLIGVREGAAGVWALLAMYPKLYTAALPVTGCGDPYAIRNVHTTPVWAWHHVDDAQIDAEGGAVLSGTRMIAGSRYMALSLRGNGHQAVRYDTYTGGDADVFAREEVRAWLAAQNLRDQLEITWIRPGLWHFEDFFHASCYLVEGKDKALLIDSGIGGVDLKGIVASLTRRPVEVAITHAHGDHYGCAHQFDVVYMHERDIEVLPMQYERFAKLRPDNPCERIRPETLRPVVEGSEIDLGGGIVFTVLDAPGHTPGSVAFLCDALGLLFTGDAVGSGEIVLLYGTRAQLPEVVAAYRESVAHFLHMLQMHPEPVYFGGHRMQDASCDQAEQERTLTGGATYYNPLCDTLVRDMIALCDEILAGRCTPEEGMDAAAGAWTFKYRRGGIMYRLQD